MSNLLSKLHFNNNELTIYDKDARNSISGLTNRIETLEEVGAQANVQPNWNETNTSSDAYILNKPDIDDYSGQGIRIGANSLYSAVQASAYVHITDGANYITLDRGGDAGITINADDSSDGILNLQASQEIYIDPGQNSKAYYKSKEIATVNDLSNKVDKETGKGLSTNDYTNTEKTKLAGIAEGAEVNVNADWNATSGPSQILHRPSIEEYGMSLYINYDGNDIVNNEIIIGANEKINLYSKKVYYNNQEIETKDNTEKIKPLILENNEYYIEKGNNIVLPLSHPDLSTQPSILPERFGKYYVYEVLIPIFGDLNAAEGDEISDDQIIPYISDNESYLTFKEGDLLMKNSVILSASIIGNGVYDNPTIISKNNETSILENTTDYYTINNVNVDSSKTNNIYTLLPQDKFTNMNYLLVKYYNDQYLSAYEYGDSSSVLSSYRSFKYNSLGTNKYNFMDILWEDSLGNLSVTSNILDPSEGKTPIGLCIAPTDFFHSGAKARFMSLKYMSYYTPDTGTLYDYNMYWGDNTSVAYQSFNYLGSFNKSYGYITSDLNQTIEYDKVNDIFKLNTLNSKYKIDNEYYGSDYNENFLISMISSNGLLNTNIINQTDGQQYNIIGYGLGDFDGKTNTQNILTKYTAINYKTATSLTNSYSSGHYPAAGACWRYHTIGTSQGDWYLGSIGEMSILMTNREKIKAKLSSINSIYPTACIDTMYYNTLYWSSTEYISRGAYSVYLNSGNSSVYNDNKDFNNRVLSLIQF